MRDGAATDSKPADPNMDQASGLGEGVHQGVTADKPAGRR